MPGKLFIPQFDVDRWMSAGLVDLKGDILVARNGTFELRLRSASLFLRVVGDATDHRTLVGKVKDEDALASLGAEAYMTSVLFDDAAYDVEAGFTATPVGASGHDDLGLQKALRALAA